MADIHTFTPKPPAPVNTGSADPAACPACGEAPANLIWTCQSCGCQSFQLHYSGETSCVRCGLRTNDEETAENRAGTSWRAHLPDAPVNLEQIPPVDLTNTIIDHQPTEFIKRSFAKAVTTEDIVFISLIRRDGGVRMWREGVDNDEQEAWMRERVEIITNFALERATPADTQAPTVPEGEPS